MKLTKKEIIIAVACLLAGFLFFFIISKFINPAANQQISKLENQQISTSIFTCSMHPQIRQNEPGKCPICGMDLIPLAQISNNDVKSPFVHTMSPEAIALANVQTRKVVAVIPEHEVYLTGKVAVNEQRLSVVTANFSGRIEKLHVNFTGQAVRKGQKLASIFSPELVTAQQELILAANHKDINPVLYNAAREKLRLWEITESQITEIVNRGVVLNELDLYSDQTGTVITRGFAEGDFVTRGAVLFEIADLSNVWVLLDAYERDLPFIRTGQKINFTAAAVPGKVFTSSISFVDPFINPQTRTASVRAEISNPQQMLKPEMFVNAQIKASLSVSEKSLVIPQSSLLWTGKRSVVYVKVPDTEFPAFEMREITLGASLGDYYIVASGLSEGEEIVTNGVFFIDAAAQLSGNYSMMNRPSDNRIAVPERFADQLTNFVNQYFELKNSLVESDFQRSKSNAENLDDALTKVDMKLLDGEPHNNWMQHFQELNRQIDLFVNANDLEKQREVFSSLSNQLIETVNVFRLRLETVFIAYCPMALNDQGAYWLSEFEEIRNPYFGDAMLECGEVRERIGMGETTTAPKPIQGHQH
jgi:Cu(I)/Ag(I) efflux system membrane fusion protein